MHDTKCGNFPSLIFICFYSGLVNNIELLKVLKREAIKYNDVLLFDFWESYWNLSVKSAAAINWAVNNSPVNILMKIDDDILCNVSRMYGEMMKRTNSLSGGHNKLIIGKCDDDEYPNRDPKSTVYSSKEMYATHKYPRICKGGTYLITRAAGLSLLNKTTLVPLFKQEDVYVSVLANASGNVHLYNIPNWRLDTDRNFNLSPQQVKEYLSHRYYSVHIWPTLVNKLEQYWTYLYP